MQHSPTEQPSCLRSQKTPAKPANDAIVQIKEIILFIPRTVVLCSLLKTPRFRANSLLFETSVPKHCLRNPFRVSSQALNPNTTCAIDLASSSIRSRIILSNGYQKTRVTTVLNRPLYAFPVSASDCSSGMSVSPEASVDGISVAGASFISNAPFANPMPPEARTFAIISRTI